MKLALQAVNLGRWADLMQASIPHWPYTSLPALRVLRRKSHVGEWYVHVPSPAFLVHVCVNLRTGAVYVGQTSQAPIQRLRKHYGDARAGKDSASFHAQLLLTDISNWVTIPVQYCDTPFQAGWAERQWWADLHKWALNDLPPGMSETDTPNKQRAYINSKMLHTLHKLCHARDLRDAQRVKALQGVLRDMAQQIGLPFHVLGLSLCRT